MDQLIVYLTFNGNCREAMKFYKDCLGGELSMQTVGDTPESFGLPRPMKKLIVQAFLKSGNIKLMGSDMVHDEGLIFGNANSIFCDCRSVGQMRRFYRKLTVHGKATHPIRKTFWGGFFGGLTDQYGHHWLFHCRNEMQTNQ